MGRPEASPFGQEHVDFSAGLLAARPQEAKLWRTPTYEDRASGGELLLAASGAGDACGSVAVKDRERGSHQPPWLRRFEDPSPRTQGLGLKAVIGTPSMVLAGLGSSAPSLSDLEVAQASRFRSTRDSDAFVAAHLLARLVVGELASAPVEEVVIEQSCGTCREAGHGPPAAFLPARAGRRRVEVSWSHTRSWVMAAASDRPIGVDAEDVSATPPPLSGIAFCEAELDDLRRSPEPSLDALRWWTRKEALVKLGLMAIGDLGEIDVRNDNPLPGMHGGVDVSTYVIDGWVASFARQSSCVPS